MPDDPLTSKTLSDPEGPRLEGEAANSGAPLQWSGISITVNDQRLPLAASTDIDALMEELAAAVAEEPRFVHLDGLWGHSYEVMVTATTSLLLTRAPLAFEVEMLDGQWTDRIDLDIW